MLVSDSPPSLSGSDVGSPVADLVDGADDVAVVAVVRQPRVEHAGAATLAATGKKDRHECIGYKFHHAPAVHLSAFSPNSCLAAYSK